MLIEKIRKQIKFKLHEKKLSIRVLEKQAGLPTHAVGNILRGTSNNPGIVTLEAIANVLECSIDELVGKSTKTGLNYPKRKLVTNQSVEDLIINIFDYTIGYLESKGYEISLEKLLFFIKDIADKKKLATISNKENSKSGKGGL